MISTSILIILITTLLKYAVLCQVVKCKAGTFKGREDFALFKGVDRPYVKYLGIPYGESTAGERRFSKPVPKPYISGTYDATYMRPACPQMEYPPEASNFDKDEDCLNLNVYVPFKDERVPGEKLPVIVWIYGGAYVTGAAQQVIPDVLSTFGDVIVVVMNYRLSLFGFFSTNDEESPGNYALWDQHLALKWVNDNIEAFGGDRNRVTIGGESAGGISVVFQALYPGNRGLFQRAIAQSGSALMAQEAFNDKQNTTAFLELIGCNRKGSKEIMSCMREKDTNSLVAIINDPVVFSVVFESKFYAVKDGDFFLKSPREMFEDVESSVEIEHFASLDYLSGVTSMEGAIYMYAQWAPMLGIEDVDTFNISRKAFESDIIPKVVSDSFPSHNITGAVTDAFVYRYTDWTDPDNYETIRLALMQLTTDYLFLIPAIRTADAHKIRSRRKSTYFYQFGVQPSMVFFFPMTTWMKGSDHGSDIPFVFGMSKKHLEAWGITQNPDPSEYDIAEYVMTYWTNFAKTGNPNEPMQPAVVWPQYTLAKREYLQVLQELSPESVKTHIAEPRTAFWLNLLPSLMRCQSKADTLTDAEETGSSRKDEL